MKFSFNLAGGRVVTWLCRLSAWLLACVLMAVPAYAAEMVGVKNAWVRATAPGQKAAGAYLELTGVADAALVAVDSPLAGKAELHSMSMDGGVMRMRAVEKIELPAGKTVKLAPGGLHVMLLDIRQAFKEGSKVPLTLTFQGAGGAKTTQKIEAQVRAAGSGAAHHHH